MLCGKFFVAFIYYCAQMTFNIKIVMNVEPENLNVSISMYFPVHDFEKPSKNPIDKCKAWFYLGTI
jgi:hypothetical protein